MNKYALKSLSIGLAVLLLLSNSVFVHAYESNFWKERRKDNNDRQLAGLPLSLPNLQTESSLQRSLLSSQSTVRTSKVTHRPAQNSIERVKALSEVPSQFGTVRNFVRPSQPTAQVVLHVQDVHLNEEAQSNIDGLTRHLAENGHIDLVALEGAFGNIPYQKFQNYHDQNAVKMVADYFLKENRISGAAHAAFIGGKSFPALMGVDDKTHYHANIQAYLDSSKFKKNAVSRITTGRRELEKEKQTTFSAELASFDAMATSYKEEKLPLTQYAQFLANTNSKLVDFNLQSFLEAAQMERSLDLPRIEKERTELLSALIPKLTQAESTQLVQLSVAYRLGNMNHVDFYNRLNELCDAKGISVKKYSRFDTYVRYMLLAQSIDSEKLLDTIDELETAHYGVLAKSVAEKELVERSKYLVLCSKLVEFSLSAKEWSQYCRGGLSTRPNAGQTIRPLEGNDSTRLRATYYVAPTSLRPFEKFYEEAERRNDLMVENLLGGMKDTKAKSALLVTGGFHAEGIDALLRSHGITVIPFVPRLTRVDSANGSSYLSVFAQEKTPLDKLFAGEKLFIPPTTAEVGSAGGAAIAMAAAAANPNLKIEDELEKLETPLARAKLESTDKGNRLNFKGGIFTLELSAGAIAAFTFALPSIFEFLSAQAAQVATNLTHAATNAAIHNNGRQIVFVFLAVVALGGILSLIFFAAWTVRSTLSNTFPKKTSESRRNRRLNRGNGGFLGFPRFKKSANNSGDNQLSRRDALIKMGLSAIALSLFQGLSSLAQTMSSAAKEIKGWSYYPSSREHLRNKVRAMAQTPDRLPLGSPTQTAGADTRYMVFLPAKDISSYDTLTFTASGKGNLYIRVLPSGANPNQPVGLYRTPFTLTTVPQTFKLNLSELTGIDLKSVSQISFHIGTNLFGVIQTGNPPDRRMSVSNVAAERGNAAPAIPAYNNRDIVTLNRTNAAVTYLGVATVSNANVISGDVVDANGVKKGRYAFNIFQQDDIKGDSILRIDNDATGTTDLMLVDATRTRFFYFAKVPTNHPRLATLDVSNSEEYALGQFFSYPHPINTAETRQLLPQIIEQFIGPNNSEGYILRRTLAASSSNRINEFQPGELKTPSREQSPLSITVTGPGEKDTEILFKNEPGYTQTEIRIDGPRLLVNGKPYFVHGVTASGVHPTDTRQQAHFTLAYMGGEPVIKMMADAGINTVRTYLPPDKAFLDACQKYGIRVLVEFANFDDRFVPAGERWDIQSGRYLEWINLYGTHPAILGYGLGNEYNFLFDTNPTWISDDQGNGVEAWYRTLRRASAAIQALDVYKNNWKPIYTAQSPERFGNRPTNGVDELAPLVEDGTIDMIGFNVYRDIGFNNGAQLNLGVEAANKMPHRVPVFLSEFAAPPTPDETLQAERNVLQWTRYVAPMIRDGLIIGGTAFAWQEEAYKPANEKNYGWVNLLTTGQYVAKKIYEALGKGYWIQLLMITTIPALPDIFHFLASHAASSSVPLAQPVTTASIWTLIAPTYLLIGAALTALFFAAIYLSLKRWHPEILKHHSLEDRLIAWGLPIVFFFMISYIVQDFHNALKGGSAPNPISGAPGSGVAPAESQKRVPENPALAPSYLRFTKTSEREQKLEVSNLRTLVSAGYLKVYIGGYGTNDINNAVIRISGRSYPEQSFRSMSYSRPDGKSIPIQIEPVGATNIQMIIPEFELNRRRMDTKVSISVSLDEPYTSSFNTYDVFLVGPTSAVASNLATNKQPVVVPEQFKNKGDLRIDFSLLTIISSGILSAVANSEALWAWGFVGLVVGIYWFISVHKKNLPWLQKLPGAPAYIAVASLISAFILSIFFQQAQESIKESQPTAVRTTKVTLGNFSKVSDERFELTTSLTNMMTAHPPFATRLDVQVHRIGPKPVKRISLIFSNENNRQSLIPKLQYGNQSFEVKDWRFLIDTNQIHHAFFQGKTKITVLIEEDSTSPQNLYEVEASFSNEITPRKIKPWYTVLIKNAENVSPNSPLRNKAGNIQIDFFLLAFAVSSMTAFATPSLLVWTMAVATMVASIVYFNRAKLPGLTSKLKNLPRTITSPIIFIPTTWAIVWLLYSEHGTPILNLAAILFGISLIVARTYFRGAENYPRLFAQVRDWTRGELFNNAIFALGMAGILTWLAIEIKRSLNDEQGNAIPTSTNVSANPEILRHKLDGADYGKNLESTFVEEKQPRGFQTTGFGTSMLPTFFESSRKLSEYVVDGYVNIVITYGKEENFPDVFVTLGAETMQNFLFKDGVVLERKAGEHEWNPISGIALSKTSNSRIIRIPVSKLIPNNLDKKTTFNIQLEPAKLDLGANYRISVAINKKPRAKSRFLPKFLDVIFSTNKSSFILTALLTLLTFAAPRNGTAGDFPAMNGTSVHATAEAPNTNKYVLPPLNSTNPRADTRWIDIKPAKDLSGFSVLSIKARGKGKMYVRMLVENGNPNLPTGLNREPIVLTDTEQTFYINMSNFQAAGTDLRRAGQVSFHIGTSVWDIQTGNPADRFANITTVAVEKGIIIPPRPLYNGRDTVMIDRQGNVSYLAVPTTTNVNTIAGEIVDEDGSAEGRYTFYIFPQADIKGDAILRLDNTDSSTTDLIMVDATRTRYTTLAAGLPSNLIRLRALSPLGEEEHALGQFFSYPTPINTPESMTQLKNILSDLSITTENQGFIYRNTLKVTTESQEISEFRPGSLVAPVRAQSAVNVTVIGPGDKDVEILHPNEMPLVDAEVTTNGRQLFVNGEPYFIHGVTVSGAHPGDVRQRAHFTLDYIGGEKVIKMMADGGVNTVRLYLPPDLALLDACQKYGIRVLVEFTNFDDRFVDASEKWDIQSGRYLTWIKLYGHHPAILGYGLGNEYNRLFFINPTWISDSQGNGVDAWYRILEKSSKDIQALDVYKQHWKPIYTAQSPEKYGTRPQDGVEELIPLINNGTLHMVGFNVYRGGTLQGPKGNLAVQFANDSIGHPVPMFYSEIAPEPNTADEKTQAERGVLQWARVIAPTVRDGLSIGATEFAWQEEGYKPIDEKYFGWVNLLPSGEYVVKMIYNALGKGYWIPLVIASAVLWTFFVGSGTAAVVTAGGFFFGITGIGSSKSARSDEKIERNAEILKAAKALAGFIKGDMTPEAWNALLPFGKLGLDGLSGITTLTEDEKARFWSLVEAEVGDSAAERSEEQMMDDSFSGAHQISMKEAATKRTIYLMIMPDRGTSAEQIASFDSKLRQADQLRSLGYTVILEVSQTDKTSGHISEAWKNRTTVRTTNLDANVLKNGDKYIEHARRLLQNRTTLTLIVPDALFSQMTNSVLQSDDMAVVRLSSILNDMPQIVPLGTWYRIYQLMQKHA